MPALTHSVSFLGAPDLLGQIDDENLTAAVLSREDFVPPKERVPRSSHEDAERVAGRIGKHVKRFVLVMSPIE